MQELLKRYQKDIRYDEYLVERERQSRLLIEIEHWREFRELFSSLPPVDPQTTQVDYGDAVTIRLHDFTEGQITTLNQLITKLIPWRKGPFRFGDMEIDTEWRSCIKWDRIAPFLKDISGKRIADIGSNNGYYMFRMLPAAPELVVGFDPNAIFYHQFHLINHFVQSEKRVFELLGVEHMPFFPEFFDTALCMGIIYHRRDPVKMLQEVRESLKPGGELFLESITIPGADDYFLKPAERYAMMRNVWFVPTPGYLKKLLHEADFIDIEHIDTSLTTSQEQRKTDLAPYKSLEDFLDPNDSSKTIEGYPAPWRTVYRARKPE